MKFWYKMLTLICDEKEHSLLYLKDSNFYGFDQNHCLTQARQAGWSIGKRVLCPGCNPRKKKENSS